MTVSYSNRLVVSVLRAPGSCGLDQLEAERNRDPVRNLGLQDEQVPGIAVEPLRPQMRSSGGRQRSDAGSAVTSMPSHSVS